MTQKPLQSDQQFSGTSAVQGGMHDVIARAIDHRPAKAKVIDIECDGSKTLLEQQAAINHREQTSGLQLVCYQKSAAPKNSASVKQVLNGQTILPLLLLELPASTSVFSEVTVQLAAGRHLVFYTAVYVRGIETKVAGFR